MKSVFVNEDKGGQSSQIRNPMVATAEEIGYFLLTQSISACTFVPHNALIFMIMSSEVSRKFHQLLSADKLKFVIFKQAPYKYLIHINIYIACQYPSPQKGQNHTESMGTIMEYCSDKHVETILIYIHLLLKISLPESRGQAVLWSFTRPKKTFLLYRKQKSH